MKKIIVFVLFVLFLNFVLSCGILRYVKPRFPKPQKVEGGILFQYYAPSARRVTLAGEFNNWEYGASEKAIIMKKNEEGVWSIVVPLKPGRYKYKFVVDDSDWRADPNGESAYDADGNSLIVVD
ncbi:MAG: glycogen-binding domain-containing protein [Spirochaetes bacterium]|nr:glycogen-binding domain-containing protein [Spirochaetota bacterium]